MKWLVKRIGKIEVMIKVIYRFSRSEDGRDGKIRDCS